MMEFKKEYLLLIRNRFIQKQLLGIFVVVAGYWLFLYSDYYRIHLLPVSDSWIAFLANLAFILLFSTYMASTVGHAHLLIEKHSLPFFKLNPASLPSLLSSKFAFQFLISGVSSTILYWLFFYLIGPFQTYDPPFFRTVYFTLIFAVLAIQAVSYASSMKSLPDALNILPDKNALRGFVLALFVALLTLQVFQYQIQKYLDYLVLEEESYPALKMYLSVGIFFIITVCFAVFYLESGYKNLVKRLTQKKQD